jgi:hypothetical protein
MSLPVDFRWLARVTYRGEKGPIEVDFCFEEIAELDDLIERGPDWNTIDTIVVWLNLAPRQLSAMRAKPRVSRYSGRR